MEFLKTVDSDNKPLQWKLNREDGQVPIGECPVWIFTNVLSPNFDLGLQLSNLKVCVSSYVIKHLPRNLPYMLLIPEFTNILKFFKGKFNIDEDVILTK